MLLAIVGTRFSGKSEVRDYYVSVHGFVTVRLDQQSTISRQSVQTFLPSLGSFLSGIPLQIAPTTLPGPHRGDESVHSIPSTIPEARNLRSLTFPSAPELLSYVTKQWRSDFVTMDLYTRDLVSIFVRRPFFVLLSVDAPVTTRFLRSGGNSLEQFVHDSDRAAFGADVAVATSCCIVPSDVPDRACLLSLRDLVGVHVFNSFRSISELHVHLKELDLLDPERLRPGWDAYFMTLASLASQRSNCMKRRVGAVLVRDNRVVSTGYNGTPRGLRNCNEGGCAICNSTTPISGLQVECVCLHAEENALLEAGRERIGKNAVLYCNTCPCLRCTIKIIQTGLKAVVYNLSYKVDEMSASLFREAGVELRRYNPPKEFV